VIQKSDTAISHPDAVMIDSHNAAITVEAAVFRSWRHNLTARLTPCKLTNLRNLSRIVLNLFLLYRTLRTHLQELDIVVVLTNNKHTWCLLL